MSQKRLLVAVRDITSDLFFAPQCVINEGNAKRAFSEEVNRPDEKNTFYKYPGEYELFVLGEYDEQTAKIETLDSPKSLGTGNSFKIIQE